MKLKDDQSGVAHVVAIVMIIVIVAIGFVGWQVWKFSEKKQPTKSSSTTATLGIDEIITELKKTYASDNFLKTDEGGSRGVDTKYASVAYSVPSSTTLASTPATASFYLVVHQSGVIQHGASITDQANLDKNTKIIASKLMSNGFSFVGNPPVIVKLPNSMINPPYNHASNGYYVSDAEVCLLGSSADVSTTESPRIYMNCVTRSALSKVAEAATPFAKAYDAYIRANPTEVEGDGEGNLAAKVYFTSPSVKESKAKGYKYAEVDIASTNIISGFSATGYFYTDASGNNWQFAQASQQGAYCSKLKTADAKIALADICSDGPR